MKRAVFLMAASVGMLAACSGLNETDFRDKSIPEGGDVVERVVFEAPVIPSLGEDGATRIALGQERDEEINFSWEALDTVGIFPDKGSQVYFEMADGVGTSIVQFDGGGWALRQDSHYSCYYPFVCDMKLKRDAIPVSFVGQVQTGVSDYRGMRFCFAAEGTTPSLGEVRVRFKMLNTIIRIKAIGLPPGTYSKLSLTTDEPLFVQQGTFGLEDMSITGKTYSNTLEISLKDFTLEETSTEENPVLVYFASAPVDLSGHPVIIQAYSEDGSVYKCEKTPTKTYEAGRWGGLKCNMEGTSVKYSKASSITLGGIYLIVDSGDKKLFKGATDGPYVPVSPDANGTDTKGSLAGYEFTLENSGSDYFLKFNDGKYLICNYVGDNGATGLFYVDTRSEVTYPYTVTTGNNGAFFFNTTQKNSSSNTNQFLYHNASSDVFKIGGSGSSIGVHLYVKDGKQDRGLRFDPESVTCTLDSTPEKPVLSGSYTTVTYSSSNENIATVDAAGNVTPLAAGNVTITATAAEDEQFSAGTASYSLIIKFSPSSRKYVRVTSVDRINTENEYVIVYENGAIQKAFKPILNAGHNAFSTSAENAVDITVVDDEIEADKVDDCRIILSNQDGTNKKFSLTVPEADGTVDYYFIVYGKTTGGSGNSTVFFASPTETGYRSTFSLSSAGVLTIAGNSGYNFQYSSSGYFTAGTGSTGNLYLFVREDGPVKQRQTLAFAEETVSWALGDDYEIDRSYDFPQQVSGARTAVTYSADPESVAIIEGSRITIKGSGSATITATAAQSDEYYAATASYTLRILKAAPTGWVDQGPFNLENPALYDYLNDAGASYSDTDDADNTVMSKYTGSAYSDVSRKDCPAPVTITWTNPASSSTVITIYEDQTLGKQVWSQKAADRSTSAEVYNLIPGRTYYYTVSENSSVWEKGYFSTTGRRRMIKVSNVKGRGHANNCRDLGGLEVMDKGTKKTIKYGLLFRSTNMDKTTDDEKAIISGFMRVVMDIDLRDGNTTNANLSDDGSQNCYQPFPAATMGYINPGFRGGTVIDDLIDNDKVKTVLTTIFNTVGSGNTVLFHCYSGADRTGYFAMLIEGLLGVSEKDCSIDYELTSFCDAVGSRYRTGKPTDYVFRQGIAFLRGKGQPADTFQDKIETYLIEEVGFTRTEIENFKSAVLE